MATRDCIKNIFYILHWMLLRESQPNGRLVTVYINYIGQAGYISSTQTHTYRLSRFVETVLTFIPLSLSLNSSETSSNVYVFSKQVSSCYCSCAPRLVLPLSVFLMENLFIPGEGAPDAFGVAVRGSSLSSESFGGGRSSFSCSSSVFPLSIHRFLSGSHTI